MAFLDRIRACNAHDLGAYRPLYAAGHRVGWVREAMAARLAQHPSVFVVEPERVTLAPEFDDYEARSTALESVLLSLRDAGVIAGWRDEAYPVTTAFSAPPLLQMERAAIPHLGVRAYGVHMNGFVRDGARLRMWVARRARDKPTFPGMLDNMVAGGQPVGISLAENLIKECAEEASIPRPLAERAVPVGAISYTMEVPEGVKPDVQFCYDLELPPDFVPAPADGEIESFALWPIERVAEMVAETAEFKFNCNLVIIDFLVRHGMLGPEHPDYLAIVRGLHQ